MTFKEMVEKNFTIFFLSLLLAGFTAGYGCYKAILSISDKKTIGTERLNELTGKENELVKLQIENKRLSKDVEVSTGGKVKVQIISEAFEEDKEDSPDATIRNFAIYDDINGLISFVVDQKTTSKNKIKGFEQIDNNVKAVIMHRHAFQEDKDDIALTVLKNYFTKDPKTKFIIYSSAFNNEHERNNYMNKLNSTGIKADTNNLVYFPYSSRSNQNLINLQQESARLKILKEVLELIKNE